MGTRQRRYDRDSGGSQAALCSVVSEPRDHTKESAWIFTETFKMLCWIHKKGQAVIDR